MAERTILVCDVCGRPAVETVGLKVGRRNLQKDYCEIHLQELTAGARIPRPGRRRGVVAAASTARRRGRPKKGATSPAKRRGRPRKAQTAGASGGRRPLASSSGPGAAGHLEGSPCTKALEGCSGSGSGGAGWPNPGGAPPSPGSAKDEAEFQVSRRGS